jgi:hypothetical protein
MLQHNQEKYASVGCCSLPAETSYVCASQPCYHYAPAPDIGFQ